jgi:hypothetical protein
VEGSRQHIGEPSLVAVGRAGLPVIEDRVQPVDLTLRETAAEQRLHHIEEGPAVDRHLLAPLGQGRDGPATANWFRRRTGAVNALRR